MLFFSPFLVGYIFYSCLIVQLPCLIVFRRASVLEDRHEVNLDKLPLGPVAEMTKYSAKNKPGKRKRGQNHVAAGHGETTGVNPTLAQHI